MSLQPRRGLYAVLRVLARVALSGYPRAFRESVGDELLADLESRVRECHDERGGGAAFRCGVRELADLIRAAAEARRELGAKMLRRALGVRLHTPWAAVRALRFDLRQAARGLRASPATAFGAVLLTGVGLGIGASIFSVIDGVLWKPLSFDQSEDLVYVWGDRSWQGEPRGLLAEPQISALRENASAFEGFSAIWMVSGRILGGERPVHTDVARTSANFFDLLGVEPKLGRTFVHGEDQEGSPWVAILDYDYWVREFGSDPDVIGRTVVVGWQEMEVVGVLPADFRFRVPDELGAHGTPDLWIPWWHRTWEDGRTAGGMLAVLGRIRPDASADVAQGQLDALAVREDQAFYQGRGFGLSMERLRDRWVADAKPTLMLVGGAAALLFVVTMTNLGLLLLARTRSRTRELALREALGAGRARTSRLVMLESFLLAGAGSGVGLGVLLGVHRLMLPWIAPALPRIEAVTLDIRAAAFLAVGTLVLGAAAGMGALMGGLPARSRGILGVAAADAAVRRGRGRSTTLVMSQAGLCVVLLMGTGLMVRAFQELRATPMGFRPMSTVTFSVYLMNDYEGLESQVSFYARLRQSLESIPGVVAVGGSTTLPLAGGAPRLPASTFPRDVDVDPESFFLTEGISVLLADQLEGDAGNGWTLTEASAAQPGYFEAIGASLVEGRGILPGDDPTAPFRMVVDRPLAERFWDAGNAVGQRLWVAGAWREIIGVVEPIRVARLGQPARPQIYLPHAQVGSGRASVVVHAAVPPAEIVPQIREAVARLDPLVPIADVRTTEELLRNALAKDRLALFLMVAFSVTATLLVLGGIYSVQAFNVGRRRRDIAVRKALGARGRSMAVSVVVEGLRPTVVGALLGGAMAVLLARGLSSLLHGVAPHDPVALLGSILLILLVAGVASWFPARSAFRMDPAEVLRRD